MHFVCAQVQAAAKHSSTSRALVPAAPTANLQRPEDALGYEVVTVGPTTNIVGDAMSQTALDIVHAELGAAGPLRLGLADAAGDGDGDVPEVGDGADVSPKGRTWDGGDQSSTAQQGVERFRRLWLKLQQQGRLPAGV